MKALKGLMLNHVLKALTRVFDAMVVASKNTLGKGRWFRWLISASWRRKYSITRDIARDAGNFVFASWYSDGTVFCCDRTEGIHAVMLKE